MKASDRGLTWLAVAAAAATGLPLLVYRHILGPPAEDALAHVGEPLALYAHIVVAPWLLFVCGMLWPVHVLPHLRARTEPRRPTGVLLALALLPLVLTGYLAQATDSETAHTLFSTVHGFGFAAWMVVFGIHAGRARAQRRSSTRDRVVGQIQA